jgi:hypothetical protein
VPEPENGISAVLPKATVADGSIMLLSTNVGQ